MMRACLPRRRTRVVGVLMVLALLTLTGCLSVPTSGPVVTTRLNAAAGDDTGFTIVPAGPARGESPGQIVDGFLDAMEASPLSTTVARRFLGPELASAWDPSRETITYTSRSPAGGGAHTQVALAGGQWLDRRGAWRGALPAAQSDLGFDLAKVHGQWRITQAPNALIVPQSWFDNRFTQMSVYFFDSTARILVPEPVFVPTGPQQVSTLVRYLLAGPGPQDPGMLRTFLPSGGSESLSVPVSPDGLAQVDIGGGVAQLNRRTEALMQAQLAWTLGQDATIRNISLTLSGATGQPAVRPVTFSVDSGAAYDPSGYDASVLLYGIHRGVLGTMGTDSLDGAHSFSALPGGWGTPHDLTQAAVSITGGLAAGVEPGGRVLYGAIGPQASVSTLPLHGTDLLRPAWDHADRLWLVDRTERGAVVEYVAPGPHDTALPAQTVRVPGVSGQDVRSFLVSRDGTRLVAVVHGPVSDRVVVSRLIPQAAGGIGSATPVVTISDTSDGPTRWGPIAWDSPTTVFATQVLVDSSAVRELSVDGSGANVSLLTASARISGLLASPQPGAAVYGVAPHVLLDLAGSPPSPRPIPAGVTSVFYAG